MTGAILSLGETEIQFPTEPAAIQQVKRGFFSQSGHRLPGVGLKQIHQEPIPECVVGLMNQAHDSFHALFLCHICIYSLCQEEKNLAEENFPACTPFQQKPILIIYNIMINENETAYIHVIF